MADKRFNRGNFVAITCAAILVGTEILAAALALGWALGGLSGLGSEVTMGLVGLCLALGIYLTYRFIRAAVKAEPIYE